MTAMPETAAWRADESDVMPPTWPYYTTTRVPTTYRHVFFQVLLFTADATGLAAYLPRPLEPMPERECALITIDVPYASSYGPFQESFLLLPCALRGEPCTYAPLVFLNNVRAIVAGREIWGTPKVWADVTMERQGDMVRSRTVFEGCELVDMTTTTTDTTTADALPNLAPAYRLKLIPSADGKGWGIKQLVTATALEPEIWGVKRGTGSVRFGQCPDLNLSALGPRATGAAFTYTANYRETFGRIVHDYLQET